MFLGLFGGFHGHDDNFHYGGDHFDPYLHDDFQCDGIIHTIENTSYIEINNNFFPVAAESHLDLLGKYEN